MTNRRHHHHRYTDDDYAVTAIMTDHHSQQQRHLHHHKRTACDGDTIATNGGGDNHWRPVTTTARPQPSPPRKPNKKLTNFRKFGGNRTEIGPDNRSFSSPSHYEPFRRANEFDTCETVEWEAMSKHFARLQPFINDNVEKVQNGYPQTNHIPQNHHLQYYSDLHKLHQVAYATRNPVVRKPPQQQQQQSQQQQQQQHQPCCKPWQWSPYGGPAGTFMNAYYLSEPVRYAMHAINVIQEDSRISIDEADQLSSSVWRRYLDNRQSVNVYDTKMTMWCRLSELVKSRAPGCGLYLVGSTMNGFGGDVSDADFCLLTGCAGILAATVGQATAAPDERHRVCGVERLQWLMKLLEHERLTGTVCTTDARIVYAKVPILRFRWTDGGGDKIDVDLCCNNVVGIRNTHLLYCYSRLDYRVRPLVLTIKLWASCHNINDPKKMTLSSYSLVLMVINFLQCVKPPVLPSLQCIYGMKFSAETNIEYVHMHEQLPSSGWKSDNEDTLGELLLQFFQYYSDFNYYKYAVSVRMGRTIPLERCRMAETVKNDPGQWKFIGIEEPFERTNTARSVHNHNIFIQIKDIINKSYTRLNETKSLNSIFCELEKY